MAKAVLRKPDIFVALHPEGVDRNRSCPTRTATVFRVALHPEGVDRNAAGIAIGAELAESPSTRRAWIEMTINLDALVPKLSPSTRRAWIEIHPPRCMI